jgi:hypothetical protein
VQISWRWVRKKTNSFALLMRLITARSAGVDSTGGRQSSGRMSRYPFLATATFPVGNRHPHGESTTT